MIFRLFTWWYTDGWKHAVSSIRRRVVAVMEYFSVDILVRTLWEPWKQIKSYAWQGSSLGDKMRVAFDNAFARMFGFILRISLIMMSLFSAMLVTIWSVLLVLLWPILPLVPFICLAIGLKGGN